MKIETIPEHKSLNYTKYKNIGRPAKNDYDYTNKAVPIMINKNKYYIPIW